MSKRPSTAPAAGKATTSAPGGKKKPQADPYEKMVDESMVMIMEHQAMSSKARVKALMQYLLSTDKDARMTLAKTSKLADAVGIIDRAYLKLLKDREKQIEVLQLELNSTKGGWQQAKEAMDSAASDKGSLESQLKAAQSRIQQLENDNKAMLEDLQRAEYAAAAATSECLALQEAAAGIAVADSRRQKIVAMRLAELKDELRKTKHQLRVTRVDGKKAELGIMKLESERRALEHEADVLKESLQGNGVDLEVLEAQRMGNRGGISGNAFRQPDPHLMKDAEARLRGIRQPSAFSLFEMAPQPKKEIKKKQRARAQFGGMSSARLSVQAGKENVPDDIRSVRSGNTIVVA